MRRVSMLSDQVVISIGKIKAGDIFNVIPQSMEIEGTIRSLSRRKKEEIIDILKKFIHSTVESLGGKVNFKIENLFPPVVNDKTLFLLLKDVIQSSPFELIDVYPTTISEDFSYFLQKIPGIYFFIGIRNEKRGIIYPHHHPYFDIDEKVLPPSVKLLKDFILKLIEKNKNSTY